MGRRREPPPPSVSKDKVEDCADDDSVEEEAGCGGGEFGSVLEKGGGVKKKKDVSGGGGCGKKGSAGSGDCGGGVCPPCCQADKCSADLNSSKRYHRRHKVCELHAKAPTVIVAGLQQRFCQQCSRFHELSEFDDIKRSCRRRLAGRNERRRKSLSESHGEGSSRRRLANHCRLQADDRGRTVITFSGNPTSEQLNIP